MERRFSKKGSLKQRPIRGLHGDKLIVFALGSNAGNGLFDKLGLGECDLPKPIEPVIRSLVIGNKARSASMFQKIVETTAYSKSD